MNFHGKYWDRYFMPLLLLVLIHSHKTDAPKIQSQCTNFKFFSGEHAPRPPSLHADCALHNKSDIIYHLIKRAPLLFYAPNPLISLGAPYVIP